MAVITKSEQYPRRCKQWTKGEHKRLRRLYPIHSIGRLTREFGRTANSISCQASKLGLKKDISKGYRGPEGEYRLWTDEETAFLRRHYKKLTCSDIAAAIGRGCSAVAGKLSLLGLRKATAWTAKENELLKKVYNKRPLRELTGIFGRSHNTISKQARKLKIPKRAKPWTNPQIKYMRKNYGWMTAMEMAKHVGHSPAMIRAKARKLGFSKDKEFRKRIHPRGFLISWTPEQVDFVKKNYQKLTAGEIAAAIGKTLSGVQGKASNLGLKKVKFWTPQKDKRLRNLYGKISLKELAGMFGRSKQAVFNRARELEDR